MGKAQHHLMSKQMGEVLRMGKMTVGNVLRDDTCSHVFHAYLLIKMSS